MEFSIHHNSGQHCQANSRIYVEESAAEGFVEKLVDLMQNRKLGDPVDKSVFQGPQGDELQRDRIVSLLKQGSGTGRILCGGKATTVNGKVRTLRITFVGPSYRLMHHSRGTSLSLQ